MKNLLTKSAVAAAVAGSLMFSGAAGADSLLAPLIVQKPTDKPTVQTFINFKMRGNATVNNGGINIINYFSDFTELHYTWIKKGTTVASLYDPLGSCVMEDTHGSGTSWDMIFQDARGNITNNFDGSNPSGYTGTPFVGMLVLDDKVNISDINDGDMSGFAYVVNVGSGEVLDYKLLNNHNSTASGDFSAGFISKHAVDFAWGPAAQYSTQWLVSVTSADMAALSDSYAGKPYDAAVAISQVARPGEDSPQEPTGGSGAYDNDEVTWTGSNSIPVVCMAMITRDGTGSNGVLGAAPGGAPTLLLPNQISNTANGGWMRRSIIPSADTTHAAVGAIVYKTEEDLNGIVSNPSFVVETGGHLAPGNHHVNRPY